MKSIISIIFSIFIIANNSTDFSIKYEPNILSDCLIQTNCVRLELSVNDGSESYKKARTFTKNMPRTTLVMATDNYIHAEVESRIMHYIDDLEILLIKEEGILQIRSASRVGIRDFGVNQKRVLNLLNGLESMSHNSLAYLPKNNPI